MKDSSDEEQRDFLSMKLTQRLKLITRMNVRFSKSLTTAHK